MSELKLGLVGCGAVTKLSYVPFFQKYNVKIIAVADKNEKAAKEIAEILDVEFVESDYQKISDKVEAVIIALPNYLHAEASSFFLEKGLHVLCEKPMAVSVEECDKMVTSAVKGNARLMIGHVRRYFETSKLVKEIISNKWLGEVKSFLYKDGGVFRWPGVSNSYFDKRYSGGGVLMDIGPHVLDLVLWWLGDYIKIDYYDDNFGGVEANCEIRMKMASGVEGIVKMSRTVSIEKVIRIIGEKGYVEFSPYDFNSLRLFLNNKELQITINEYSDLSFCFKQQLDDFISYINRNTEPLITLKDAKKCFELIENCYKNSKRLNMLYKI